MLVTVTALVPAVPALDTLTISKPAIVVDGASANAKAVVEAIFNVSVPSPPLILSKEERVVFAALNVSFPLVPGKLSTPVVSVRC